jgi:2,3-dihydroxybenzoate decarboxylase
MRNREPNGITRRGFLGSATVLFGAAGIPAANLLSTTSQPEATIAESMPMPGKIALEEHFVIPETLNASYGAAGSPEFRMQLEDIAAKRIAAMDRGGIDVCVLSLVGPGIQGIPDTAEAIRVARRANDHLAEQIAKSPKRFRGFAALPLQDPTEAAKELTRCVRELRFCGTLVNGFSQVKDQDSEAFYDLPPYRDFWATVQELDVPFYLHPRSPLPKKQPAYDGHACLTGSIWGFTAEALVHALHLMGGGLFDEYPTLRMILGHLGEGLPANLWRIDNRIARTLAARPKAKLPISHYLRENFYITTSGNFRTQTLTEVMLELGAERILYSVDYPFEDTGIAADWFDHAAISDAERMKIGRTNSAQLFRIQIRTCGADTLIRQSRSDVRSYSHT